MEATALVTDTTSLSEELLERARDAPRRVLVLDYDGTLVPFAAKPEEARPDVELPRLLNKLAQAYDTWVVSGRSRASLEEMVGRASVGLGAEHGAYMRPHGGEWKRMIGETHAAQRSLPALTELTLRFPGSRIEAKEMSFCWHYRLANPRPSDEELRRIELDLQRVAAECHCALLCAVLAFEIRPRHAHKGLVVRALDLARDLNREHSAPAPDERVPFVLIAGDDVTDADMFTHAPPHAIRLAVGERLEGATHRVATPKAFRAILERLAER